MGKFTIFEWIAFLANIATIGTFILQLESPVSFHSVPQGLIRLVSIVVVLGVMVMLLLLLYHSRRRNAPLEFHDYVYIAGILLSVFTLLLLIFIPVPMTSITDPPPGGTVDIYHTLHGTSQDLGDGTLWIIVYSPENGKYYPQAGPVVPGDNGNWASPAIFGNQFDPEKARGKQFVVYLVLADAEANAGLNRYFSEGLYNLGLNSIPKGTKTYDCITVIRG
jgi:hypothetical protein